MLLFKSEKGGEKSVHSAGDHTLMIEQEDKTLNMNMGSVNLEQEAEYSRYISRLVFMDKFMRGSVILEFCVSFSVHLFIYLCTLL